ncbi:MAG: hypothetical protein QM747_06635 [Nocardioides sp.]
MERMWVFDHLAVAVARTDFFDPAVAGTPDGRERGVRIEIRPARWSSDGTIYVSDAVGLDPAFCRIDFLESAPGAADRMHWHPSMPGGEPGDRTFERAMPPDPVGWLKAFLTDLGSYLERADGADAAAMAGDLDAVEAASDDIAAAVADGLAWAREPWPDAVHDERGRASA